MADKDNVTKFPITYSQRRKNQLGSFVVECEVSGRFLKFHEKSSIFQSGEFITVDVMTFNTDNRESPRKLCELVLTRENLMEALKNIVPNQND
jgi:hypothetical protein